MICWFCNSKEGVFLFGILRVLVDMTFKLFRAMDAGFSKFRCLSFLTWLCLLVFFVFVFEFWAGSMRGKTLLKIILQGFFSKNYGGRHKRVPFSLMFFSGFFVFLMCVKFTGLFPYVFGVSTQILLVLSIALILWLTIIVSKVFSSIIKFFRHLVPAGRPLVLRRPLSVVELIRILIRPFTLRLRLSIKMTTGHVFIGLIRLNVLTASLSFSVVVSTIFFLILGFYFLFELGICVIQAFVFNLLCTQYLKE